AERFAELARSWPQQRFLLVEGPADAASVAPLTGLPGALLARGLEPRLLAAVLARASAYVGNDSGVTHLAAAWGAPTLALFGPTLPGVWAPLGRVRVLRSPSGRLADVSAAEARAALAELGKL